MHFDLLTPCTTCPFRKAQGCALTPARARSIGRMMLDPQGATFACHKTTHSLVGNRRPEQHCAGALIFAEKQKTATQMMRIAERMGIYDAPKLMDPKRAAVHALVFDSLPEFVAAQRH